MIALTAARLGMTAATALVSAPARAARAGRQLPSRAGAAASELAEALGTAPRRQVWRRGGSAHLEVHDLAAADAAAQTLAQVAGVHGARVDPALRRLIIHSDPESIALDTVSAVLDDHDPSPAHRSQAEDGPGYAASVRTDVLSLALTSAGVATALAARFVRLPVLPSAAAAAVTLLDQQPHLRGALERRLGPARAQVALAAGNAVAQGLGGGLASLAVEAGQRISALQADRERRAAFELREADLCGDHRPVMDDGVEAVARPRPVPPDAVDRLADRAAAVTLPAAGLLGVVTRSLDAVAQTVLIGAPKAARAAREVYADALTVRLSRRGVVIVDPAATRLLDRVTTVVLDSTVLLGSRPVVVDAAATAEDWTREHVWSAGQRMLDRSRDLKIPPPPGRDAKRLDLVGSPESEPGRLSEVLLTEDGSAVGSLVVGREPNPYADAVVSAVLDAGLRLVLTDAPSTRSFNGRADRVLRLGDDPNRTLQSAVRDLQAAGDVVLLVSGADAALAAADVGIGVVPANGRVPWRAALLVGPGLEEIPRILAAVPEAKDVVERGVQLALGGSVLGGLLAAVGTGRRGGATLPVNAAAGSALASALVGARRVDRLPAPRALREVPWHLLEPDDVVARLAEDANEAAAQATLQALHPQRSGLRRFVRTVRAELADPLTPVLATGAAASAVIGSPTDAVLVGSVLAANAVVSGLQRLRAENAARELFESERPLARIVDEDGSTRAVPADQLRPGDRILVEPGDVVPADARLLAVDNLEMDEAGLTGESIAVPKQVRATPGAELADRACMVYESSTVLAGTGRAVVVATDNQTEAGRALQLARRSPAPAGMQARLEELTRRGLPVTLLGGAAITVLSVLRGQPLRSALGSGVSVAVAAVPEGLPLVATVAQLSAARRLSRRGVLVRSARTVEALGRVDTICFDKTGTLTEGRLRLVRVAALHGEWPADAPEARSVLRAAARACPQPGGEVPHATDRAVLDAAVEYLGPSLGSDWSGITEVPFQSERGFSATLGRLGDELRLVVKGAPEVLLPRCVAVAESDARTALDRSARQRADKVVESLAGQGLRVLAVAGRRLEEAPNGLDPDDAEELADDLVLLGFVALADIPRPAAAETVTTLAAAGIDTVMITGDHPVTALAIARQLGIAADRVVTGPELADMDDEERTAAVGRAHVFARVSPEQKLRIVRALQRAGRVVAMTGDGANDAAAIRLADVGIGMTGRGSAAARSASDLVLIRPELPLLVDALVEGRAMWRRVRDAVSVLLGGNAGEVAFTLAGTGLSGQAPIGTRQFLLVNMLTDLLPAMAIALAATPDEDDARSRLLMEGRPSLGSALTRDIAVRGGATAAGALLAWHIGRVTGTRGRASTMALAALVGTQLGQTLLVGARNPIVVATGIGSAAVLVAIVQTPGVSQFFGCRPMGPLAWATVAGSAAGATAAAAVAGRIVARNPPSAAGEDATETTGGIREDPDPRGGNP